MLVKRQPSCLPARLLQVRVLQCVSSSVELLGDRLRPHLHTICSALPQVRRGVAGLAGWLWHGAHQGIGSMQQWLQLEKQQLINGQWATLRAARCRCGK